MRQRITQKAISKLIPPTKGNSIEYDSEIPGFGVRITCAGVVAFVLNYRIHGRERRLTIGRHPELTATAARERAIQLRGKILDGQDPLEEKDQQRAEASVLDLAEQYLSVYALEHKRPSSIRNDRQMIEKIIGPGIGMLRVKAVSQKDVQTLHNHLRATPYRANRVLALLSKMFTLAIQWGWRSDNPVCRVPRFHEDRRERWLSVVEVRRLMEALDSYAGQNAANALRLLLLTGARESEVLTAEWSQFDLDRGIWTKPSHHTKQKKIEHVPLSHFAIALLRTMRSENPTGVLFPGANGRPRVTLHRPWVQACKEAGLAEPILFEGKKHVVTRYRPLVRIHDLRHTYASHLVSAGASLHIVGKLLGHTQPQTTARYAHVADQALRSATEQFVTVVDGPSTE